MKSFLQSQEWVDFQKSLGRKVWEINGIIVVKHILPIRKNYLYAPRCGGDFLSKDFLDKIEKIAKEEKSIFLKAEPQKKADEKKLRKIGFKKSSSIQPTKTLILDIKKSEEYILKRMHQKTRYNIKLALKRGLKVQNSKLKVQNFEKFWELLQDTAKRGRFHTHLKEYYEKLLNIPGIELFIAKFKNKIIAVNIVLFYNKQAIYLHGASDYKYRNLMAPHLLQWHQILEAKKRRCEEYDFWGIDEKKWPGVTRFKKGFAPNASKGGRGPGPKGLGGGRIINYLGAYDLVFRPMWYLIYKITRLLLTRFR